MFLLHIALRFLLAPRSCLIYCCKYTVAYYFHYHLPIHYSFQSLFKFPRIHSFLLHCLDSDLTFRAGESINSKSSTTEKSPFLIQPVKIYSLSKIVLKMQIKSMLRNGLWRELILMLYVLLSLSRLLPFSSLLSLPLFPILNLIHIHIREKSISLKIILDVYYYPPHLLWISFLLLHLTL